MMLDYPTSQPWTTYRRLYMPGGYVTGFDMSDLAATTKKTVTFSAIKIPVQIGQQYVIKISIDYNQSGITSLGGVLKLGYGDTWSAVDSPISAFSDPTGVYSPAYSANYQSESFIEGEIQTLPETMGVVVYTFTTSLTHQWTAATNMPILCLTYFAPENTYITISDIEITCVGDGSEPDDPISEAKLAGVGVGIGEEKVLKYQGK